MKKKLLTSFLLTFFISILLGNAHRASSKDLGVKVSFDFDNFKQNESFLKSKQEKYIALPLGEGGVRIFKLKENLLSGKTQLLETYDGVSEDGKQVLKLSVFSDKVEAFILTDKGYVVFEPENIDEGVYRIYNLAEIPQSAIACGTDAEHFDHFKKNILNSGLKKAAENLFPVGDQLRVFRLAAAATGEMTALFETQDAALVQIVAIMNTVNLIYEQELAISFNIIDQTYDKTIIFEKASSDPYNPNESFADAYESQNGFDKMNASGILLYNQYDVGHTFHTLAGLDGYYSVRGQAGPRPCIDDEKALGWSEWTHGSPLGAIVSIFAHEVGHQFAAEHTYNARGGSIANPTFCTIGWSNSQAIEPGGGSTMMAYGSTCQSPYDQSLTGDNRLSYFHAVSINAIETFINEQATCYTLTPTNNQPPVVNAGVDITIPKGTPFRLNGLATDADGDEMTYTWEQCDAATYSDRGALGTIVGEGGYSAVNSSTAPLFRSERSTATDRTFPKLKFIRNNKNKPDNLEGEALPQVARTMTFKFMAKDLKSGIDMDEIKVHVSDAGPLEAVYPNGDEVLAANTTEEVRWNVNSTNTISENVDILLSIDGGFTYPYLLAENVPNTGSCSVDLPNVAESGVARIKVSARLNANAEFFDISDADFIVLSSCKSYVSMPCLPEYLSFEEGDEGLNLQLEKGKPFSIVSSFDVQVTPSRTSAVMMYQSDTSKECFRPAGLPSTDTCVFRVSESGNYTISYEPQRPLIMMLFSAIPTGCDNFVGANAYNIQWPTSYGYAYSMTLSLDKCQTYYLYGVLSTLIAVDYTINITGPGNVYVEQKISEDIDYTYLAISNRDNKVKAVSVTADFSQLLPEYYTVRGMSFAKEVNPESFLDKTLNDIQQNNCALMSSNYTSLKVGNPEPISSVEEVKSENIVLYPSPVNDVLNLKADFEIEKVEVYDLSGQKLRETTGQSVNTISLSGLPSGVYMIKAYSAQKKIYLSKIVKS